MLQRRRRSAAITLVLAGSLGGCGEPVPQRDVYRSFNECYQDWSSQAQQCEPVRDGRYAGTYFYGPSYYGPRFQSGTPKASRNAVAAVDVNPGGSGVQRNWFGTRTSSRGASRSVFSSSSSYTGSRSSGTSRGGFGSSGRTSIS